MSIRSIPKLVLFELALTPFWMSFTWTPLKRLPSYVSKYYFDLFRYLRRLQFKPFQKKSSPIFHCFVKDPVFTFLFLYLKMIILSLFLPGVFQNPVPITLRALNFFDIELPPLSVLIEFIQVGCWWLITFRQHKLNPPWVFLFPISGTLFLL